MIAFAFAIDSLSGALMASARGIDACKFPTKKGGSVTGRLGIAKRISTYSESSVGSFKLTKLSSMVSPFWRWLLLRNANHIRQGLTAHLQEIAHG